MLPINDYQKIGIGVTGFGLLFLFLGMMLFFDRGLLAIGNILFISGLGLVIGLERTFRFFFQRDKLKGSAFFLGGIIIVLYGWAVVGMLVEIYGFIQLFKGFFPVVINFLRRVPVIGNILMLPGISSIVNFMASDPNSMV